MNNMFSMFNTFGMFRKRRFELYKPYINYTWSNTFQVVGKMYSKDSGTAGLNLQQFFGQGCWFNGIDMQITIPVNATIQTEIKRVNGLVEINTNTQNLTNYNVYSGSGAKVYKDIYLFKKSLSQIEIENYNNNPNQFFMDALEDSSCILAMPMCEKDGFVRNYKSYSEGSNLVVDGSFGNQSLWVIGDSTKISISGNAINFNNSSSFVYPTPFLAIFNTPITINKCFMVELEVFNYQSGSVRVEIGASVSNNNATPFLTSNGKYQFIVQHTTNSAYRPIFRAINFIGSITNLRVKELTSIYPITNYLATCRTNAQRLSYGLQTSGFKRASNGLILGKSNFLECDEVGIATRIGHSETVKIKTTVNPSLLSGTVLSGGISLSTTGMIINRDNIITLENQNPTTVVTFGNGFSGTIKEYKEEK